MGTDICLRICSTLCVLNLCTLCNILTGTTTTTAPFITALELIITHTIATTTGRYYIATLHPSLPSLRCNITYLCTHVAIAIYSYVDIAMCYDKIANENQKENHTGILYHH